MKDSTTVLRIDCIFKDTDTNKNVVRMKEKLFLSDRQECLASPMCTLELVQPFFTLDIEIFWGFPLN